MWLQNIQGFLKFQIGKIQIQMTDQLFVSSLNSGDTATFISYIASKSLQKIVLSSVFSQEVQFLVHSSFCEFLYHLWNLFGVSLTMLSKKIFYEYYVQNIVLGQYFSTKDSSTYMNMTLANKGVYKYGGTVSRVTITRMLLAFCGRGLQLLNILQFIKQSYTFARDCGEHNIKKQFCFKAICM